MTDNFNITEGSGKTIRSDDVAGAQHQIIKMDAGGDGASVPVVAGRQADAASIPTALSTEDVAILNAILAKLTSGAASAVKLEDDASANADAGMALLAVRKATPANTSGADGDYEFLQINAGRLWTSPLIEAGENHIGQIGGLTQITNVTMSLDTSAYASGDLLADTQQIDAAFRKADGTGVLYSLTLNDHDDQGVAMTVYFLSANVSMGTENSAPSISDANADNILGYVDVATSDWKDLGGTRIASIKNIGLPVKAVSGTDDLYIAIVNGTGAPTFTASGIVVRVGILED